MLVGAAVVPVISAVVILVFVTCIAAVFAVHLFSSIDNWNFGICFAQIFCVQLETSVLKKQKILLLEFCFKIDIAN